MSPLLLLEPNALIGTQHHTHTLKPQNPYTALVTAYRSVAHPPTHLFNEDAPSLVPNQNKFMRNKCVEEFQVIVIYLYMW